jgi:hypothetical protein
METSMALNPYGAALEEAAEELEEITAQFDRLHSRKGQLETLVGAFRLLDDSSEVPESVGRGSE